MLCFVGVDTALLRNVQREFKTLEKAKQSPSTYDVLDIAGALRHLLIDDGPGLFKRAWDEIKPYVEGQMPKQPTISAVVLDRLFHLPHIRDGKSIVIAADATVENGVRSPFFLLHSGIIPDDELKEQTDLSDKVNMRLDVYKRTHCMIINNWAVRRETVVKYVANKLGGRHYDKRRRTKPGVLTEDDVYTILDQVFDFFGDNPSPNNLQVYYGPGGNALHAVVLGICTDLEESPDVQWFLETLNYFLDVSPPLGFK